MTRYLKILFIEDNRDDVFLLVRMLKTEGYSVEYETVDNGREMSAALDGKNWDVVICDYSMPGFGGEQALELFKNKGIDIPFILLSGAVGEDIAVTMMKAGVSDYITKQNVKLLAPAIERALHDMELLRERKESTLKLQESEARYRQLVETIPYGIQELTAQGDIIFSNSAIKQIYGYDGDELIGKNIGIFFIDDKQRCAFEKHRQFLLENQPEPSPYITKNRRKDGRVIDVQLDWNYKRANDGEITGFITIISDVTQRRQVEEQLEYLSFHDKLTQLFNRAYWEEVLITFDNNAQLPLSIIMGDINGLKLVNDTFGHLEGDRLLIKAAQVLKEASRSQDIICRWGGDEFTILLPQTSEKEAEKICTQIREACPNSEDTRIPLSISLGISSKINPRQDMDEVLKEAEDRLYRNKMLESKSIRSSIITSLQKSLAEKTAETEQHARRLQEWAVQIGRYMELSNSDIDELILLAALHDIGKIAIPDHILNKKGPLNQEEWERMKTHCELGFKIAASSPDLMGIANKIITHHERWDGTGYPQGLKGYDIPLLSRIIAVVDAYDVMTCGRPYKGAISNHSAIKELLSCAGTQFDPHIVKIFIAILNRNLNTRCQGGCYRS